MNEVTVDLVKAHAKLIEALTTVKEKRDRGDDDWEFSLLRVYRMFLKHIQMPSELIAPTLAMLLAKWSEIEQTRRPRRGGRPPKPSSETLPMASAAALVTALTKHDVALPRALDVVSRKSGIDRKRLKNLRDNCHRAVAPPHALKSYNYLLAVIESDRWSVKKIADASTLLRGFC